VATKDVQFSSAGIPLELEGKKRNIVKDNGYNDVRAEGFEGRGGALYERVHVFVSDEELLGLGHCGIPQIKLLSEEHSRMTKLSATMDQGCLEPKRRTEEKQSVMIGRK